MKLLASQSKQKGRVLLVDAIDVIAAKSEGNYVALLHKSGSYAGFFQTEERISREMLPSISIALFGQLSRSRKDSWKRSFSIESGITRARTRDYRD